jgi:hypothetical protein
MAQLGEMIQSGSIEIVDAIKTFDITELEQAMVHFSTGSRIGKVVVTFEDPKSLLNVSNFLKTFYAAQNTHHCAGCSFRSTSFIRF